VVVHNLSAIAMLFSLIILLTGSNIAAQKGKHYTTLKTLTRFPGIY